MSNCLKSFLAGGLIMLAWFFASCDVGLGESVDTVAPSVEITYPPANSVIRSAFAFAGTCSDDKGVASVSVTVLGTDRKAVCYTDSDGSQKEYVLPAAAVENDGRTWRILINEQLSNGTYPLSDGTYICKVQAKDGSGRTSDWIERSFEIDNTEPVFIISSPAVTDSANATEYGSVFKISGKIADDHEIRNMNVTVYDKDGNKIDGKDFVWTFANVDTAGGMSVTAARYFTKSGLSAAEQTLHNNYINIYGEGYTGDKIFTCTVELEDAAQEWVEPVYKTDQQPENTARGNVTTSLWLNDDIYEELMGANSAYQLEAGGIKKIWNGTDDEPAVLSILQDKRKNTAETKLAFSLNKKAEPTYSIGGYDMTGADFAGNSAAKNGKVTFMANAGRNGIQVNPATFTLYLFGPFEPASVDEAFINGLYSKPTEKYNQYHKEQDSKAEIIWSGSDYKKGSVDSFTQTVTLPESIANGSRYIFAATGSDLDGLNLETDEGTVYGFTGIAAGTPPQVTISFPDDDAVIKSSEGLFITGTASSTESKIKEVAYEITVYDYLEKDNDGNYNKVGTVTGLAEAVDNTRFGETPVKYSCDVSKGTFVSADKDKYPSANPSAEYDDGKGQKGQIFVYEIVVVVRDDSASESNEKRRIYLDNAKPVPLITNVDPVAEKQKDENGNIVEKKINGTVTISGKVTEKNLKSLVLTVEDIAGKTEIHSYSEASFEESIDTTLFSDGKVVFTLTATDEAGNESSVSENYKIDQTTDKPVIKFSNGKDSSEIKNFTEVDKTKNTFGVETNNKAVFSFTDDDGLEKVTITLLDKDGMPVDASDSANAVQVQENQTEENPSPVNPVVYTFDGSTTSLVNYILPKREGRYILKVEAVDVEYKNASGRADEEKIKTYRTSETMNYIAVSDSNFNIKFTGDNIINDECTTQLVETEITGIVTVSAVEKIKSIERYEITQNAQGDWVLGSLVSSYKNDATEENPNTITIKKDSSSNYVQWTEKVPQSKMQEGVKNFRYIATDITEVSVSIDLKWNVDNTVPSILRHSDTKKIVDKWLNSRTQTLTYIVQDAENNSYASGIDSVKYSFKNGESTTTEGYFARGDSCDENGNTKAETKGWILYKTTFDLPEGEATSVTVTVSDKVGNEKTDTPVFKIDTNIPTVTSSIPAGKVLQNTESISVTFDCKDATSGIYKVEFATDSNMSNNVVSVTDFTSPYDYSLSGLSDCTYSIYVRATDNAGNKSEAVSAGEVIVDTTAPIVEIKTPVSGAIVNKTISFAGMVTDNNLPNGSEPVLWYKDKGGTSWQAVSDISTSLTNQEWTITGVDTTKLHNTTSAKDFEFRVVFTDEAGNENNSDTGITLTVDQNADRPEIKLTNISISGSSLGSNIVQGVISDDDGVSTKDGVKLYRIDANNWKENSTPDTDASNWKSIPVEAGTGIWKAEIDKDEAEGSKNWYFYVIDEAGGEFCTKASSPLERPYLTDGSNEKTDNQTGVSFFYDLTAPTVSISLSEDGINYSTTNTIFGGSKNLCVRAIVFEAVKMAEKTETKAPAVLYIGGVKQENTPSVSEDESTHTYTYNFASINLAGYPDNAPLSVSVTVEDSAGNTNKDILNITIDNAAPTVKIISPTTSLSDAVSSAVSVKGIVQDDKSSIAKLEYVIPKKDVADDSQEWKAMGTAASWDITFASGAPDSSDSLLYYAVAKNSSDDYVYQIEESGTENIYKVPIWFRVSDSAGNEQIVKDQYVLVDSEGGKPKAWINSPENGAVTSGVVTIYGGASDNVSVKMVCVQIDADNDGDFDTNDATYIRNSWSTTSDELKTNIVGSDANWYIPASGTNSWKLNVDTGCIPVNEGSKNLRIRVKAIDDDDLSRDWTFPITVKIDSETPVIKNLKLVQYGKDETPTDSTPTVTEREYVSGMYISDISAQNNGHWYLTGEVSDNESLSEISFTKIESSTSVNIDIGVSDITTDLGNPYTLRVPLKTDSSGVISYAIKAKDDNTGEATVSITINIDSTSPSLYNTSNTETLKPEDKLRLKSMSKTLGTGEENSTVVNNNNFFTFGDVVSEAGSGLAYTAFYFERDGSSEKRIYNPMFNSGNKNVIDAESFTAGKVYINGDGLAALCVIDSSRKSEDSITLSSANANIRKGGLIKIAGGYSLITEVSGKTVKFSPTASTSFTEAELILAQVVDHKITESVGSDGSVVNDDGDEMIETINQIGSSYNWTASVDSNNIPDGPITIHVVAIDNAGNTTHGSVATKVENNRPRIAKVLLGTDLNGNGKYDWNASSAPVTKGDSEKDTKDGKSFGEFSYFTALDSNSGKAQSVVTLNSGSFKVIEKLCIIPEFVGGNNGLGYMLEYPTDLSNAGCKTGDSVSSMTSKDVIRTNVNNTGTYEIANEISDFGGIELELSPSSYGNISITFWDETEETTQGKDSQWVLLKIPVKLMTAETENPESKIRPFYWNSSTENSVYTDGAIKGHIELEKDLTSSIISSLGNDPKVSGKIKIEGTVYDNVRISSISASVFGGTSSVVASYNAGVWTQASSLPTCVESFTAEDIDMSQNGHTVKYTMIVDTEKLSGSAGLEKTIIITAVDWKNNTSETSSTQTVAGTITVNDVSYSTGTTNYYKMDVVPYVTEVKTDLSEFYRSAPSVYARTAQGKYPVNENETITLVGYNLGTSPTVTLNGTTLTGSNLAYDIGETASSGKLSVTVGTVQALNNINDDTVEYNQQPNGVNNNTLNDNIEFDVWQFKEAARAKNGPVLQPHMKVGPSGQLGFSYANATLYFNMPGEASNGTVYGQTPFGRNFGGFTQNTFTYDASGTAYGVALCPDTSGQAGMSANLQFFSGKCELDGNEGGSDLNNNYYNQGYARRIENTSLKIDGSSITQNINRIQSPSMTTYTKGTNKYVYVAYYDELSRQVRFRVGSIGSSRNDIGMGLVDLAGATGRVSGDDDEPKLNKNTTRDSISGYRTETPATETINVSNVTSDIYVLVPQTYGYKYIHAWDGYSTDVAYPGIEMPLVNGSYIYKMPDTSSTKLILNNGNGGDSNKAGGGNLSISSSGVYSWNGSSLQKLTSGTISYQPPSSIMPTYDGYQYCHVVAASGVSNGTAEYKNATAKKAGQYVAVGALSDGTAVMAWYDSGAGRLAFSYNSAPLTAKTTLADGTDEWQNNSYYVSDSSIRAGTHVSMAVDAADGIHLAYYSASGGDLYYSYIKNPKTQSTPTKTVMVDSYGSVGTYTMIDVARDSASSEFIPYISFRCESNSDTTASVKIAYPVKWSGDGNVLAGADEYDRYTGNWEVSVIPTDNTPLTDYTNIGLNKNWSTGVRSAFSKGTDVSKSWSASFAVGDSTTVYGNGTNNPVLSYAVSENGVLEMAQKK
ncbi:hypothetical protein [Treponema porcinum]|uniref:hypothetical protein n=1 Tax=Treponema porcinum TaxID=261392 RepID=UPI003F0ED03F